MFNLWNVFETMRPDPWFRPFLIGSENGKHELMAGRRRGRGGGSLHLFRGRGGRGLRRPFAVAVAASALSKWAFRG